MSGETTETRLHFEGVLDKAGKRFFEGFRKRWFTLDGQDLTYYKAAEKTEENCLGTIDFSQVKAVNPIKMVHNGFQILTKSRTYTFSAPTPELLTDWVSVLRQAMQLKAFETRKNTLSSQSSVDSQYEEIPNRPNRSFSAFSSGSSSLSFDDDEAGDDLYSSVGAPTGMKPGPGGDMYSLVGASTLPKAKREESDVVMYDLVGSRPPSKSAPPTYEMVQAARKSSPSKTVTENAQEPTESGQEDDRGFYDLVQDPGGVRQGSPKLLDGEKAQKMPSNKEEKQKSDSHETDLYSLPKINRKQKTSVRGLSIISESADSGDELAPESPLEEKPPPLPPPAKESFAIEEIKRMLEEAKAEEADNETNYEQKNGRDTEDDVFPEQNVSAFEQLKEFLQRLDSTGAQ